LPRKLLAIESVQGDLTATISKGSHDSSAPVSELPPPVISTSHLPESALGKKPYF